MPTHAQDADFRDQLISRTLLDDAIEWIQKNLTPEDVFAEKALESWAEDNDYVKKEK